MLTYQFLVAGGALRKASRISSGVQKPIPHKPTAAGEGRNKADIRFLPPPAVEKRAPPAPLFFRPPAFRGAPPFRQASRPFIFLKPRPKKGRGTRARGGGPQRRPVGQSN